MTDQQGNGETAEERRESRRSPGYRGALPPREDRLARPWVIAVLAAFVLMLVLAGIGIPSKLVPTPTVGPLPSIPFPSGSGSAAPASLVPSPS